MANQNDDVRGSKAFEADLNTALDLARKGTGGTVLLIRPTEKGVAVDFYAPETAAKLSREVSIEIWRKIEAAILAVMSVAELDLQDVLEVGGSGVRSRAKRKDVH